MRVKMSIGQLVLDDDVYDIIRRHAKMTSEFKSYFEDIRNPSLAAAAASTAMVENCILLQSSISNFAMTCTVFPKTSNTVRRTLRAAEAFLTNQTGCTLYDICAETQLFVEGTLKRILQASKESTGILHVYGAVNVKTISLLRNIACEYPTLKILFSCNDKNILSEITSYMNCVKVKDDPSYNFLTALSPCFTEGLFRVIDKHFKQVFPLLDEELKKLQEESVEVKNGCRVVPSEKSFAIAVGTALSERNTSQEVIGNMLTNPEMLVESLKESILDAKCIFNRQIENENSKGDHEQTRFHPCLGRNLKEEAFTPYVKVKNGNPTIFVPTDAVISTIEVLHFFLENHVSVMLLGERGCGKSLSFDKVMPQLSSGMSVKYLLLGDSPNYEYEVEVLRKLTRYKSNIVVVENFNHKNDFHVHFIQSLVVGRNYFDERINKYQRLPNLTLMVESNCTIDEIPYTLAYNLVILQMAKDEKSNHHILKQSFAMVQDGLSSTISECWPEISDLLWSWHNYICDKYPVLSDHALFRSLNGIIGCLPVEVESKDDLLKFVFSEILNEYSPFISTDVINEELKQWKPFTELMADQDEEILFFYQPTNEENLPMVQLKTMPDAFKRLMHTYAQLKGKQYNDKLVLSPHYTRQIVSLLRAFCRYGTLAVVGPPGCGKRSAVSFCAHMLDLELVTFNSEDQFEVLFQMLKNTYTMANNENHRLILLDLDQTYSSAFDAFDLLNKIFHYYDIPHAFNIEEKMKQLFDEENERKEALLDPKAMTEALNELGVRMKEHLHLVITMTPATFELAYARYSNLFNKSGLVRMGAWPEETLIAIAEDRFLGLEKDLTIPVRNVSKACAIIHIQMINEPTRKVTSTQYLDMVKILPQLYKPLQRKLLLIRQNLQTGIDQVHKANTFIAKLTNEMSEKEPEVLRLNTEIEQLNKRLSQERINLEKASKAFRKKEVAARRKSEETQELAADGKCNQIAPIHCAFCYYDSPLNITSAIETKFATLAHICREVLRMHLSFPIHVIM